MNDESVCDSCHKDDGQDDAVPENVDRLLTLLDEINPEAAKDVREVVVDEALHSTMFLDGGNHSPSRFDNVRGFESSADTLCHLFDWRKHVQDYEFWDAVYYQIGEYEKKWFGVSYQFEEDVGP